MPKIDGNTTSALAGIILAEIERQLRVAVTGKQAAEQSLADFIPLALQAVDIAAEKQPERLPQQNGERQARQLFSHIDEGYHQDQFQIKNDAQRYLIMNICLKS
ncbi:MAG: hypothetical protein ACREOI_35050 [bacterium]